MRLARRGKDGEDGFRTKLNSLLASGFPAKGEDGFLDYCEHPFYRTAIWEATWRNHEWVVKLLAEKGANIEHPDSQGRTPLHEAAYYGHKNLVEFFLEKGHPIDPVDKFGQTPLYRAVEGGRHEVVQLLVSRKAQLNLLDSHGCTVQHISSYQGMPDMSNWLLYKGAWKNRFAIEGGSEGNLGATMALSEGPGDGEGSEPDVDGRADPGGTTPGGKPAKA